MNFKGGKNGVLRAMTDAYKATNIKVLEAESGVIALDIHLDQAALKSREARPSSEMINLVKARIRSTLQGKREKKT